MSDLTLSASTVVWLLVTVRLFAMFRTHAAWQALVGPWWTVIAAGLAGLVATAADATSSGPVASLSGPGFAWEDLAWALAAELLIGTALGLLATLPALALIGAATASAVVLRAAPKPLIGLTVALSLATALALRLHHPLIAAALHTTDLIPLAQPLAIPLTVAHLASGAHTMTVLALALLTPVLLAGLVFELTARLIGRGPAPAAAATLLAPWFRVAAAMIALGASWSAYAAHWVV